MLDRDELFINPRAQALGNEQITKLTTLVRPADITSEHKPQPIQSICTEGVCRTTWKPVKNA